MSDTPRAARGVTEPDRRQLLAHITLLLVAFSWGLNNIMLKVGFREIDPIMFGGLRLLIVTPAAVLAARLSPRYVPFVKKDLLAIIGIAFIGFSGFQVLFPLGIDRVSAPVGGILMGTMPVWVVLIHLFAKMEKICWKSIVGVVLTIIGIAVITLTSAAGGNGQTGEDTVVGVILVIGAELFFAVNTVFLRPFMRKYSVPQVTAVAIVIALVFYAAILVPRVSGFDFGAVSLKAWGTVFYSALVGLFLANLAWNQSVQYLGSTRVAVYANLPSVFVLLLGALFLGEALHGAQYVGAAVIAAGIILVQVKKRRQ
jgi:drug/metabolite transporter (DMT)-like permease